MGYPETNGRYEDEVVRPLREENARLKERIKELERQIVALRKGEDRWQS